MQIYRYKANSPTGFESVSVADDYELQKGELAGLPTPCYTPMKLDSSGNLVSATLEESNDYAEKAAGVTKAQPSVVQQQVSSLTSTVAQLNQTVTGLTAMVQAQSQTIKQLKGGSQL